ncbi:methyl-accepting chemotaxis protein [Aestuariibius sp. HNIBRBA575]|uniref:methyl-accepting chemotaxis protein n=1 Tax=Aestuariibius sp. HNIBRBA575 TaxID=3233343 RepID=UPI0034A262BD
MAIGPSRIAALTLFALENGNLTTQEVAQAPALELSIDRIDAAHTALSKHVLSEFTAAGIEPNPELLHLYQEARDCVQELHHHLTRASDNPMQALQKFEDYQSFCLNEFEPKVTKFLVMMTQMLRNAQDQRDKTNVSSLMESVTSANQVGRTIHMIAINAALEAARVGEEGAGFKLISDNVRDLAEKTQSILGQISRYLKQI